MKKYLIFDLDGTLIESMGEGVGIVSSCLKKRFNELDLEYTKKYLNESAGTPMLLQMKFLLKDYNDDIQKISDYLYDELNKTESDFFKGVTEKIKELSKNYKLFLSTGNSTKFAKKHLQKGKIYDLFEVILGSDKILKGNNHLEYFYNYSNDPDFYKNSFYIGDGNSDREFAKSKNIDFIHIGNKQIDKYEIESVSLIDKILLLKN